MTSPPLRHAGHIPRKSLGQHFLHQRGVIEQIIRSFNPHPGDCVIEIGPGLGALTYDLIPRVGQLHVVELDSELAGRMKYETRDCANVHVHHADALKTAYCDLCPGENIRLIGNLPYNISTPLLFHLLGQRAYIRDMWFMLQKEVGERILAEPGSRRYGRLSVMIQQCCKVQLVLRVASGAFTPPPKVGSVVLYLAPYDDPPHPVDNFKAFETVVRNAFAQRRKTLRNALMPLIDEAAMEELGIDPKLRPEQLHISDYAKLSRLL